MKKIGIQIVISLLGGLFSVLIYKYAAESPRDLEIPALSTSIIQAALPSSSRSLYPNFVAASEKSVNAVVHVKNLTIAGSSNIFEYMFGGSGGYKHILGTGSGVIISPDGYIVTNNHVVKNSSKLEVTLNNNKTYQAKIIGVDTETDIALLKIDSEENLPTLSFGDSEHINIGEWVLAVGNPFNLTSTVTAGIISAKARDLNPKDDKNQSFIQTDAVVNPGNSGGALVNIHGELIGINTAITSNTGSYVGYSFAVPSNIVKKVAQDLIEYGSVQKVILGVSGIDLNSITSEKLNIHQTEGFYVNAIEPDFGAKKAGIKVGDIIQKIDEVYIHKFADMSGYLYTKRPKDIVNVEILRNGETRRLSVKLNKNNSVVITRLGIRVKNMNKHDLKRYKIDHGVRITGARDNISNTILNKVIIRVNQTPIKDIEELKIAIEKNIIFGRMAITLVDEKGREETLFVQ